MRFGRFLVFAAAAAILWTGVNVFVVYVGGTQILMLVPLLVTALLLAGIIRRRGERRRNPRGIIPIERRSTWI